MKSAVRTRRLEEKYGIKVGQEFDVYFKEKRDTPYHQGKNYIIKKKRARVLELHEWFVVLEYVNAGYRETFSYAELRQRVKPPKEGDANAGRKYKKRE